MFWLRNNKMNFWFHIFIYRPVRVFASCTAHLVGLSRTQSYVINLALSWENLIQFQVDHHLYYFPLLIAYLLTCKISRIYLVCVAKQTGFNFTVQIHEHSFFSDKTKFILDIEYYCNWSSDFVLAQLQVQGQLYWVNVKDLGQIQLTEDLKLCQYEITW